jgi:hypothetical protein
MKKDKLNGLKKIRTMNALIQLNMKISVILYDVHNDGYCQIYISYFLLMKRIKVIWPVGCAAVVCFEKSQESW